MEQVMELKRGQERKEDIPRLRLEIDYELVTLHDAMLKNDQDAMKEAKQRLKSLSEQLSALELEICCFESRRYY